MHEISPSSLGSENLQRLAAVLDDFLCDTSRSPHPPALDEEFPRYSMPPANRSRLGSSVPRPPTQSTFDLGYIKALVLPHIESHVDAHDRLITGGRPKYAVPCWSIRWASTISATLPAKVQNTISSHSAPVDPVFLWLVQKTS